MLNETRADLPDPVFLRADVEAAFGPQTAATSTTIARLPTVDHFFVGADPGSPAKKSDTALVSACFVRRLEGLAQHSEGSLFNNYCVVRLLASASSSAAFFLFASSSAARAAASAARTQGA